LPLNHCEPSKGSAALKKSWKSKHHSAWGPGKGDPNVPQLLPGKVDRKSGEEALSKRIKGDRPERTDRKKRHAGDPLGIGKLEKPSGPEVVNKVGD